MKSPALALVALLLLAPPAADASTRRLALVVGHNTGAGDRPPLRYAEEDAGKVAQVLVELGDVPRGDLLLVQGKGLSAVRKALADMAQLAASARAAAEDRVVVLFYYSGHSDGGSIELGKEKLSFDDLKAWLARTGADVRIAIVDSCKSGALVRAKGGRPGPSFQINLIDELDTAGEVFLTSSAADELALESEEIRGSYFTHHLVSGLRGAADESGDGRVTLGEAYEYSYNRTVTTTSETGTLPQHPKYDYRLSGHGELIVTELSRPSAAIEVPAGFERLLVVNIRREQVIAELTSDKIRRVAVGPGEYAVRAWRKGRSVAGRFTLKQGAVKQVAWSELTETAHPALRTKGPDTARPPHPDLDPAEILYQDNFIHFGEDISVIAALPAGIGVGVGAVFKSPSYQAYQGLSARRLSATELYRILGRPDLAAGYKKRRGRRIGLMVLGGIVATASLVGVSIAAANHDAGGREPSAGEATLLIGGMIGGTALTVGMMTMTNSHPVSVHEVHRLALAYNRQLRRRSFDRSENPRPAGSARRLHIAPLVTPTGGGLGIGGTF